MKLPINSVRANTLQRLYQVKILRAERRVSEQQTAVANAETALIEATASVSALQLDLLKNSEFRNQRDVCSDPRKIVEVLRYREHIEYNLERETYYLHMAEDELADEREELIRRRQALEKIRAKQDASNNLIKKHRSHTDVVRQDALEEDTPVARHAGAI